MQRLLTTTKVLAICGFILDGLLYGSDPWAHLTTPAPESHPSLSAIAISFLFVMYSYLVLALFMALTLSTVFHFHRDPADDPHRYQAPLYPFLPAAFIAGALAIVIYSLLQRPVESLFGAATALSGIPLHILWRRSNSSAP